MRHVVLLGNPNSGKTTLFNALTGENQQVGNWPGVTVEKKTGMFKLNDQTFHVTDLPGVYSLTLSHNDANPDEKITAEAVFQTDVDLILNVIDACHLERHLYLTSQLLELGKPMVVILNMMDLAQQRGIQIDTEMLAKALQCPVIALRTHRKFDPLILESELQTRGVPFPLALELSPRLQDTVLSLQQQLLAQGYSQDRARYLSFRRLEGDTFLSKMNDASFQDSSETTDSISEDADIVLADARYQKVHQWVGQTQKKQSDAQEGWTARIDRVVLHRVWALPIFLLIMYGMFLWVIQLGGGVQKMLDVSAHVVFVQGTESVLQQWHAPKWLMGLLAYGMGQGICTMLTFIPILAAMFFVLSFLESSGYMARAAFVVDKLMRSLGLPGKAFVPMIVGFGCNVPAILAARTLDSARDRLLTVLMSPFMSCSARLTIYAVFVAAFFPGSGQNILFSLYFLGIVLAILTGFLLRKTLLKGQPTPLILELPAYHCPLPTQLLRTTLLRLRHFIFRSGKLILPVSVVLGILNTMTMQGGSGSILAWFGQSLTPLFSPMGLQANNWPATVSLLTGVLAKEVVISSLNTLYAVDGLKESFYWVLQQHFDGQVGAYAYLLFILLYIPCVSTMAAIRQETQRKWMWFSIGWSLLLAYGLSVLFYQGATFFAHPLQSILWCIAVLGTFMGVIWGLKRRSLYTQRSHHVVANS